MKHSNKYNPINCSLYDYLEMWAIKKTPLQLTFKEGGKTQTLDNVLIIDLETKNKEEFVHLNSGMVIRLDNITRINDIDFSIRSC